MISIDMNQMLDLFPPATLASEPIVSADTAYDLSAEYVGLAAQYRDAAGTLRAHLPKTSPRPVAPIRFCALQAVELYLCAYLMQRGIPFKDARSQQHNLRVLVDSAIQNGFRLRQKTVRHLHLISETREYFTMRYGPEIPPGANELQRLFATLDEVASRVAPKAGHP